MGATPRSEAIRLLRDRGAGGQREPARVGVSFLVWLVSCTSAGTGPEFEFKLSCSIAVYDFEQDI